GSLSATFDFIIISTDANPSFVVVEGLGRNWRVRIEDDRGNPFTSWATADNRGIAQINIVTKPILRNVYMHIQDSRGRTVIRKGFSEIIGGDIYNFTREGIELNSVEECVMYHKMFTCKTGDIPEIIIIRVAYFS
ncbi:MAG: hypothetical protein RMI79_02395, partial [Nitrososphaerota archaeon]|nr:hypothetical protein [Nitrososphaerota archaeon]